MTKTDAVKVSRKHREAALGLLDDADRRHIEKDERFSVWLNHEVGAPIGFFAEVDLDDVAEALASAEADAAAKATELLERLPDRFSLSEFVRAGISLEQAPTALLVSRRILEDNENEPIKGDSK